MAYALQAFTVAANADISQFPSAGSPDFAYIRANALTVEANNDHVRDAAEASLDKWAQCIAAGSPSGNQRSYADVLCSDTAQSQGFIFVRGVGGATPNGYNLWRQSSTVFRIFRLDNGAFVQIGADIAVTTPAGTPFPVSLQAENINGNAEVLLTFDVNGTTGTRSDTSGSRILSGQGGLGVYNAGAGPGAAAVDNFGIADVAGGASTPPLQALMTQIIGFFAGFGR